MKRWLCVLAASLVPAGAMAQEQTLVFDGEAPEGPPDHFFVDFEVPGGVVEIEVRHDDMSDANILDFGLDDPSGFRGWGGGNEEPAIVGIDAASRSYVPGPIAPGTWRVVIGKAKVAEPPARYHLEVVLRDQPTLAPQPERTPYADADPLEVGPRWYAGDFHTHSRESGDAIPALDEMATFARSRGLDFIVVTDHNTMTAQDFFAAVQPNHPALLLVPGVEFTTYAGHGNGIGATQWVDHKIGLPGVTFESAMQAFDDQGALFAINHPVLDIGDLCIGCGWKHGLDGVDAVEIATGGWKESGFLFTRNAIAFWDALIDDTGSRAAAIGGSDDHRAGVDEGSFQSPIGSPTTMVFASALSVPALLEGIREGRTVVKLQGPDDPMIELRVEGTSVVAEVTGGAGELLRFVRNGVTASEVTVDSDDFVATLPFDDQPGEARWRAEVWSADEIPRTVTSHVFTSHDPAGPDTSEPDAGCGCRTSGQAPAPWPLWLLALGLLRRRPRGGVPSPTPPSPRSATMWFQP